MMFKLIRSTQNLGAVVAFPGNGSGRALAF